MAMTTSAWLGLWYQLVAMAQIGYGTSWFLQWLYGYDFGFAA